MSLHAALLCRLLIQVQAGLKIRPARRIDQLHRRPLLCRRLVRLAPGKEEPGQQVAVIRVVRHQTDSGLELLNGFGQLTDNAAVACRARICRHRAAGRLAAYGNTPRRHNRRSCSRALTVSLRTAPLLVVFDIRLTPGQHGNDNGRAECGKEDARRSTLDEQLAAAEPAMCFTALVSSTAARLLPAHEKQAVAAEDAQSAQHEHG